jgi:benzoate membrane transport protein
MMALAGLALLSTIANSLYTAVSDDATRDDATREAAVISFVVAASGTSLFGIGAAFWGPVASGFANFVFIKKITNGFSRH